MDERGALSQGAVAEQMVLIGTVGTGARALERVQSTHSVCVFVVVETPQLRLAPPFSCRHWAPPQTTVLVSWSFSTGAGAGSERTPLPLLSQCILGNGQCFLLFCLIVRHHHHVCLVVVDGRGRR